MGFVVSGLLNKQISLGKSELQRGHRKDSQRQPNAEDAGRIAD